MQTLQNPRKGIKSASIQPFVTAYLLTVTWESGHTVQDTYRSVTAAKRDYATKFQQRRYFDGPVWA